MQHSARAGERNSAGPSAASAASPTGTAGPRRPSRPDAGGGVLEEPPQEREEHRGCEPLGDHHKGQLSPVRDRRDQGTATPAPRPGDQRPGHRNNDKTMPLSGNTYLWLDRAARRDPFRPHTSVAGGAGALGKVGVVARRGP